MSTFGWTPSEHRDELQQFGERLEHEDAMKDTEPIDTIPSFVLLARLTKADDENALLRRSLSVLNNRIDELEATRANVSGDAEALLERLEHIAAVLKTFYFAELSMSSVQPILALALEFNPDIVEQRR